MVPTVKFMMRHGFEREEAETIPRTHGRFCRRYPSGNTRPSKTLQQISDVMDGCGVESIPAGHNSRSPGIEYVNMGDAYDTTVMWTGRFRIGSWGDIVERGSYDSSR